MWKGKTLMEKLSLENLSVVDFFRLTMTLDELNSTIGTYDEKKEYTQEQLTEIGAAFGRRFQIKREPDDIRQAVRILGKAQSLLERFTPEWLYTTHNLSAALINMYEQTRDVKNLNRAVDLLTQLAEHIPSDEGNLPA